jgi:outer membrane immunogenic protein
MSRLRAVAAATLSLIGAIGLLPSANADGPARDRYPYTPYAPAYQAYDWSGFYIGGHLGAAHVATQWTFTGPTELLDQSQVGFSGGGQIGAQKQWGKAVLGIEVSYTWTDAEQTTGSAVVVGTSRSSDMTNLILATGRLGYAHDNMLAYAKGGYATADVDFRSSVTSTGVVTTSSSGRENGWVAGLGLDYGLTPNISIGVEYNYLHLNVAGRSQIPTPAGLAGSQVNEGGIDMQMVVARLNFKFGPRAELVPFK